MARGRRLVRLSTGRAAIVAVVAGLIVGALTQMLQGILPEVLQPIANSVSPWLSVSFVVGALSHRPSTAAVAGWLCLVFALVGFYALVMVRYGYAGSTSAFILWGVAAVLGGLVFGPAGWYWRFGVVARSAAAVGLLAAAFLAESIYMYLILQPEAKPAAILLAAIGVAAPLLLARTRDARTIAFATILPAMGLAALGYWFMLALESIVSGI
jgi:hypothetical protein